MSSGLILALAAGWPAGIWAADYLPGVGPAPMRQETAASPAARPQWKLLSLRDLVNPPATAATNAVARNDTNAAALPGASLTPATNVTLISTAPTDSVDTNFDNVLFPPDLFSPAPADSPLISPRTLTAFLKPDSGGTNTGTAGVVVPVEVGFTPPVAAPPAQSRAIYQSQ